MVLPDKFIPLAEEELPNLAKVPEDLLIDPENRLIPYEHGYITFVYDSEKLALEDVPLTFEDLLDQKYRKMLILEDPRTSSPGLSFLLWTIHRFRHISHKQTEYLRGNYLRLDKRSGLLHQHIDLIDLDILQSVRAYFHLDVVFQLRHIKHIFDFL